MKIQLQNSIKRERGCEISPTTPVRTLGLDHHGVDEAIATAEAECEVVVHDSILDSAALPTPLRLHFLEPRHCFSAMTDCPVGLLAEDPRIRFAPLVTDVFPLRFMVKAHTHTVNALAVEILLARIAMVHSNPPFWPPVFLGAVYYDKRNSIKVKPKQKISISAASYQKSYEFYD